uniref:Ribosomal protein L13 n=1 Tax=Trepomonas sp. PC1 TaxID=1076344 RepID=A0A146KAC0_9EUKA|eukprot:JAP93248.1 Ribosomal protein L13 [Trepomonas sp. PC1]
MPNLAFSLMKKQKCTHKGPRLVKTWFNQAGRAVRRHQNRVAKAANNFPRPVESLRPIVQCCGIQHNVYKRAGRGFSIQELQAVKLSTLRARQLGIAVDSRRVNKTQQGLDANVARLQEYMKRIVVFKKDAKPEEIKAAVQLKTPLPIARHEAVITTGKLSDVPKMDVYTTMHKLRQDRILSRNAAAVKKLRTVHKKK